MGQEGLDRLKFARPKLGDSGLVGSGLGDSGSVGSGLGDSGLVGSGLGNSRLADSESVVWLDVWVRSTIWV